MEAITATYAQHDEDWTVTVAGLGKELTAKAPGIIAARDRADQLVEKISPENRATTVVHLLNGSALEFTTAYMTARMNRPEQAEAEDERSSFDDQGEAETQLDTDEAGESTTSESAPTEGVPTGSGGSSARGVVQDRSPATDADVGTNTETGAGTSAETATGTDTPAERTDTAAQLPAQASGTPSSADASSSSGTDPATGGVRAGSAEISEALSGTRQSQAAGTGARPNA